MFTYQAILNHTDDFSKNAEVTFNNPVLTSDSINFEGVRFKVFLVVHVNGGDSILECDKMDVT